MFKGWYGPLAEVQTTEAAMSRQRAEFVNVTMVGLFAVIGAGGTAPEA